MFDAMTKNEFLSTLSKNLHKTVPSLFSKRRASIAIILRVVNFHTLDLLADLSLIPAECIQILFIKRAERVGDPWSGNVAFPGGKLDNGETDFDCVVRETREEIGVNLNEGFLYLGQLPDRYVSHRGLLNSNFAVCSFVFLYKCLDHFPKISLSICEVAAVRWITITQFLPFRLDMNSIHFALSPEVLPFVPRILFNVLPLSHLKIYFKNYLLEDEAPIAKQDGIIFRLWGLTLSATLELLYTGRFHAVDGNAGPMFYTHTFLIDQMLLAAHCVASWCCKKSI